MSLSLAVAVNVLLCIALLAGLAFAMSRTNLLTPHVPAPAAASSPHQQPPVPADRPARVRAASARHTPREQIPA
jgi:hypothetical protein